MNKRTVQRGRCLSIFACLFILVLHAANAQQDSSIFKLLPNAPQDSSVFKLLPNDMTTPIDNSDIVTPPQLVFAPKVVFPTDPKLQNRKATVYVNLFVTAKGTVHEAKVIESTDAAFNKYAIDYVKQLKFKWTDKSGSLRGGWVAFPVHFKQ